MELSLGGAYRREDVALAIAAPSRRLAAGALDSLPFVALFFVASGGRAGAGRRRRELAVFGLDAAYRIALTAIRGQTLGQALVGVRVVDRDSGGRPSWRQAAVRWVVASAANLVPVLLPTPRPVRALQELEPEIRRLRREHGGDRQKLDRELKALFREHDVSVWPLLPPVALSGIVEVVAIRMLLRSPLHQGPHDRAAKTLVVDSSSRREATDRAGDRPGHQTEK